MGIMSPGKTVLPIDAFRVAGLKRGCKILDVGCGQGGTLESLRENFDVCCIGVDRSSELLNQGKAIFKELDLRPGDAASLDFTDHTFDAVIAECMLSVSEQQIETLWEAYRVLKPGGKLIITDLCARGSVPAKTQAQRVIDIQSQNVNSREGVIDIERLRDVCGALGFSEIYIEDKTKDLDAFAIEIILEYGSFEAYINNITAADQMPGAICKATAKDGKLGYFLLIMQKPVEGAPKVPWISMKEFSKLG
jgi:SAM-dependent methyltransferase